jgi:hypothetical protein
MRLDAITPSARGGWRARGGALAAATMTLAMAAGVAVAATAEGTYSGLGRHRADSMEISLKPIDGGRRTQWHVTVNGPCSSPDASLGRGLGYGSGDRYAPLSVRHGRFATSHQGTMGDEPITYHYTLSGHRVHNGYAGTFHYLEVSTYTDPSIVCDSTVLHWTARPSTRPFA